MTSIIPQKMELLAPAGNMEKLKTAFHFGADAVYLAGKRYGLRAFADNFSDEEIVEAVQYAHSLGKKVYVTLNIFAKNSDFDTLADYLSLLEKAQVDAVLVAMSGCWTLCAVTVSCVYMFPLRQTQQMPMPWVFGAKWAPKEWYLQGKCPCRT